MKSDIDLTSGNQPMDVLWFEMNFFETHEQILFMVTGLGGMETDTQNNAEVLQCFMVEDARPFLIYCLADSRYLCMGLWFTTELVDGKDGLG